MAVYSKLLLSAGGGIISAKQQADQQKNTATVLIGLGGTGNDCLRTIKTQVYSRLKPDDPKAFVPKYSHIQFLGVDTDENVIGKQKSEDKKNNTNIMYLDDTEFFSIANPNIKKALSHEAAIKQRRELDWLRWEKIEAPDLGNAGAGGIRQVGRFMMMDKSELFLNRVKKAIDDAKMGLDQPTVNVHIFSGISGGTGAGSFLDVCYMVRSIAESVGGVTIFGYFFLPDVNLSRIPFSDNLTRAYIPRNGYAAMQELDYCMQLENNGGGFVQEYQGHKKIDWKTAPVDMCHLISATDTKGNVIPSAYEYAMNVTTEYIMDFLTDSNVQFGLDSQLTNYRQKIGIADQKKVIGSKMTYCVIGASCANIPLREINTYLASELFDKFSTIGGNVPTGADVENLAIAALSKGTKNKSEIYNSLLREIREGADNNYAPYADDWKYVRDYGNSELMQSYTNQTAKKSNSVETNAKSMMTDGNEKSLLGRVRTNLIDVICDIDKGPIFAYRMISAAQSHNLLNIIDGLIEENKKRWDQEAFQNTLRYKDYDTSEKDFQNGKKRSLLDSASKRFDDYEFYLCCLEQHKLSCTVYEKLDEVLRKFREQITNTAAEYYIKLNRVTDTLINTFKENRLDLAGERIIKSSDGFSEQMMTIGELKPSLDAAIKKINIPSMMNAFMALLLNNEEAWITEDENKIAKLVTNFFIETAFEGFADKTITSFLADKYNTENNEVLTNKIYKDWMEKLTAKASPLFYYNGIWSEGDSGKLAYLSIPRLSGPIKAAAELMYNTDNLWKIKESDLTDRIYVMCSACALPLCSYKNCDEYEGDYFSSNDVGRHLYEGKEVEGMKFNDWRKLPSLTPQSLIKLDSVPYQLRERVEEAQSLYEEAQDNNIFDTEGHICAPSEEELAKINSLADKCNELAKTLDRAEQIQEAKDKMNSLNFDNIKMIATEYAMPNDGFQGKLDAKLSVRKDHFVYSPVYHQIVRDILNQIKDEKRIVAEAKQRLSARIEDIEVTGSNIDDYFDAIFTGVISFEGVGVSYHPKEFGMEDVILSKRDKAEYPFCTIPLYQGFINYQKFDKETKDEIAGQVSDIYDKEYEKLQESAPKLKGALSTDRLNAWLQLASGFAERKDIVEFLKNLKNKFELFCMEQGV